MNALALPEASKIKVLEPEHLRAAADVAEAFDRLPQRISSPLEVLQVQDVMRRASGLNAAVDAVRVAFKKPLDTLAKHVQAQAKRVLDPMDTIETQCKALLSAYALAQEREKQRVEAEALKEAEAVGRSTPALATERAPAAAFSPKIPTRVTYVAEVTDSTLLPDEYWIPNQALINECALGENAVAIPGVTIKKIVAIVNR